MNMSITAKGILPIGVEINGVKHTTFEIRGATVMDNIEVTEELAQADEGASPLRISTAMMARQLVSLGTLAPEQITTALVRGMHTSDWNKLDRESAALEKKLLGVVQTPDTTGGSTSLPGASSEA
jgi:hypothetical protein